MAARVSSRSSPKSAIINLVGCTFTRSTSTQGTATTAQLDSSLVINDQEHATDNEVVIVDSGKLSSLVSRKSLYKSTPVKAVPGKDESKDRDIEMYVSESSTKTAGFVTVDDQKIIDVIILENDDEIDDTQVSTQTLTCDDSTDNDHLIAMKLHSQLNPDIEKDRKMAEMIQEQEVMLIQWQDPPLIMTDEPISVKSTKSSKLTIPCLISNTCNTSSISTKPSNSAISDQLASDGSTRFSYSLRSTSSNVQSANETPIIQPTSNHIMPTINTSCTTIPLPFSQPTCTIRPSPSAHPITTIEPCARPNPKYPPNVSKSASGTTSQSSSHTISHSPLVTSKLFDLHTQDLIDLVNKVNSRKRSKGKAKANKKPHLNKELTSSLSISSYVHLGQDSRVIQFITSSSAAFTSVDFPSWWLSSSSNVADVVLHDNEATIVSYPLQQSGFIVLKVERIQSQHLWRRYIGEIKLLVQSRGDMFELNEHILYHCSKADKTTICTEGLDARLGIGGNFGRGIYFSDKPVKCDCYSHRNKLMYACKVILGDMKVYNKGKGDGGLTREPAKDKSGGYYDSVKGFIAHGEEYVIYNNYRCIPLYVITYTKQT